MEHHLRLDQIGRDSGRDSWPATEGYRVLRITPSDLSESFDGCIIEAPLALALMEGAVR